MAKILSLDITNRFKILQILNDFKGSLEKLAKVLDDAKILAISDEEWSQANLIKHSIINSNGTPAENWKWDNDKVPKLDVEISDVSVEFVRSFIKEKDEKGELTLADKDLISLKELLG